MQENIFIESSTNDKRDGGMAYVFCSSVINNSFGKSVNLIVILLHSFVTEKKYAPNRFAIWKFRGLPTKIKILINLFKMYGNSSIWYEWF